MIKQYHFHVHFVYVVMFVSCENCKKSVDLYTLICIYTLLGVHVYTYNVLEACVCMSSAIL